MNKGWLKSGLILGEEIRIPISLFTTSIDTIEERLKSVNYVGETDSGIMLDCRFQPGVATKNPDSWHYRMMINWATIWCGQLKLYRKDGTMIRARRKQQHIEEEE